MTAIAGFAASVDRFERNVAPANAPIAPGTPRRATMRQSTLPKRECDAPEARVVPISARWTEADAAAGARPAASIIDDEVTP